MTKHNQSTIWITGASSGIGEAIAYQLAVQKHRLLLSGRRKDALESVANACRQKGAAKVSIKPFDLAEEHDYEQMVTDIWSETGPISVFYHCGGVSQRSLVSEGDPSLDRKIMQINFFSAAAISKALLPHMISEGGGHFTLISSLTGKFGFPYRSAYAASKHALHGFFESLYLEEWKNNIGITLACPGRVKTDISRNALIAGGGRHGEMDPGQKKGISAESCACKIIKATQRKKREIIIGKSDVLMVYFKRFIPPLFYFIAKRINPK